MKQFVYGTLLAALLASSAAVAAPEPMIVQKTGLWTANVTFEPLKPLIWQANADTKPKRFWYTILTLTNNTRQDMEFYTRCDLLTDTCQLVPAYVKIPAPLVHKLRQRYQHKYPLLQPISSVGNRLLQGEDHAVDVLVLWPDFDPKAQKVSLYITGLSNETAAVTNPSAKDADGNPLEVYLRKTLELNFNLRSEAPFRTQADVTYKGKRWVMR
jgi:hypothetical protein